MLTGERAFCVLSDGTPVDLAAIQGFYRALPHLTQEEQEPLRTIFDDEYRLRFFNRAVAEIFAIPGFVIPYLPGRRAAG
jgi:hypothetical protein